MKLTCLLLTILWLQGVAYAATPEYQLSDNIRIQSQALGYTLQYRVLAPVDAGAYQNLPIIFVTDGENYLQQLNFDHVIMSMIRAQKITPVITVFVDSRDPDDLTVNRRHSQFMCNANYARFYQQELLPMIAQQQGRQHTKGQRMIMGFSFGALNAACFGILASDTFGYLAMQSPASDKHVKIVAKVYQESAVSDVKMFMTVGTRNDNTRAGRAFNRQLQKQGYDVEYHEVPYGHNWENWRSTLELILQWFAPLQPQAAEHKT